MNVYDFDGTIYNGDSGIDFVKFALSKRPFLVLFHLLKCAKPAIEYKLGKIDFKTAKSKVFSFVSKIDNLEEMTKSFAEKNKHKIKNYYPNNRKDDDLIISASLDFYLLPLCKAIGLNNVMCTKYDVKNGEIIGENCKGPEKVKRFEEVYGKDAIIENAYGDSKGDIQLLNRAQKGFMIVKQEVTEYKC